VTGGGCAAGGGAEFAGAVSLAIFVPQLLQNAPLPSFFVPHSVQNMVFISLSEKIR